MRLTKDAIYTSRFGAVVEGLATKPRSLLQRAGLFATPARVERVWPGIAEQSTARIRLDLFTKLVGEGRGRSLLDLGAGPCFFSRLARDAGWVVTAVDARSVRVRRHPKGLEGITFVESDVRDFDTSGYHTVAILGLLYHLPLRDQRDLLERCSNSRVILETQVHVPGVVPPAAVPWGHDIVSEDGYQGVVYPEGDTPQASIGNPVSLWLTERSLLRLFADAGFSSVDIMEPPFYSKYGPRKYFVLDNPTSGPESQ